MEKLYVKSIMYILRKKLGVKKNQLFYFQNQKNKNDRYYISTYRIKKIGKNRNYDSNLRINYLTSLQCLKQIRRTNEYATK